MTTRLKTRWGGYVYVLTRHLEQARRGARVLIPSCHKDGTPLKDDKRQSWHIENLEGV